MREADLEAAFVAHVRRRGGRTIKVQSQGPRGSMGWPDRLVLLPEGRVYWIEFKSPDRTWSLTELQARRHRELRELGHHVSVHDDGAAAKAEFDKLWIYR